MVYLGLGFCSLSNGGQTYVHAVKDAPADDPTSITVQKLDRETGEASDLSGASLAGARFTVTYYDGWYGEEGTYDSVPDGFPSEHKRQWVFETEDKGGVGHVDLRDPESKVSGDDLYFGDSPDYAVYPLGIGHARNPSKGFAAPRGLSNGPRINC